MAKPDMIIKLEIEPIVKLECKNLSCENNLTLSEDRYCNLKHVQIDECGYCKSYRLKSPIEENLG